MNRLFRNSRPGATDYAALCIFLASYAVLVALILMPDGISIVAATAPPAVP